MACGLRTGKLPSLYFFNLKLLFSSDIGPSHPLGSNVPRTSHSSAPVLSALKRKDDEADHSTHTVEYDAFIKSQVETLVT